MVQYGLGSPMGFPHVSEIGAAGSDARKNGHMRDRPIRSNRPLRPTSSIRFVANLEIIRLLCTFVIFPAGATTL